MRSGKREKVREQKSVNHTPHVASSQGFYCTQNLPEDVKQKMQGDYKTDLGLRGSISDFDVVGVTSGLQKNNFSQRAPSKEDGQESSGRRNVNSKCSETVNMS